MTLDEVERIGIYRVPLPFRLQRDILASLSRVVQGFVLSASRLAPRSAARAALNIWSSPRSSCCGRFPRSPFCR
jgi:hypothetical protein